MRRLLRGLGRLAGALGLVYALVLVAMVAMEGRLIFPRPSLADATLAARARAWQAQELRIRSADGTALYGWRVGAGPHLALLLSGNGSSVGDQDPRYQTLLDAGFAILHVNYRGYPGSAGSPDEAGLIDDAAAAWREALESHEPRDIVIMGKSLGGGVAVGLAERLSQLPPGQRPGALVLESTFSAAWKVGAARYPWLPVRLLMANPFPSIDRAPHVRIPTLIIHGEADAVVPIAQARELAAALPGSRLIAVPGAGHNDILWGAGGAKAALDALLD